MAKEAVKKVEPFNIQKNPTIDPKLDHFIKEQPELWAKVKATPKEYFERHFMLQSMNRMEQRQSYGQSIIKALDKPENAEIATRLRDGVSRIKNEQAKNSVLIRDARTAVRLGFLKVGDKEAPKMSVN